MSTLDATRAELALIVLYLNKAEARDKICRAIQYGSKFLSDGQPGTAQNVDKSTSLARKVFRLFKVELYDITLDKVKWTYIWLCLYPFKSRKCRTFSCLSFCNQKHV
jgi:hypothetical protein